MFVKVVESLIVDRRTKAPAASALFLELALLSGATSEKVDLPLLLPVIGCGGKLVELLLRFADGELEHNPD